MAPIFVKRHGGSKKIKELDAYGFLIDQTKDDVVIEYVGINKNYNPAHMDYSTGTFEYGDWSDVFFIKNTKPCIVFNTGKIYHYLDKNNFFVNEENVSVENYVKGTYGHCTMIEFPKIYWKVVNIQKNVDVVWVSDKKLDEEFECYANKNVYGEEIDKFYVSAFESILNGSDVVSCANNNLYLIGTTSSTNKLSSYFSFVNKKNSGDIVWSMMKRCDKTIIIFLLVLMSKSIDCQKKYGNGNVEGYNYSVSGKNAIRAGSMVKEGMFKGYDVTNGKGVKVFGIENFWGNTVKQVRCSYMEDENVYIKMIEGTATANTQFGASRDIFDFYFNLNDTVNLENGKMKLIKKMHVGNYGFFPKELAESDSEADKYFKDAAYFTGSGYCLEGYGGHNFGGTLRGMNYFSNSSKHNFTFTDNFFMSLKPRASIVNA